MYRDPESFWGKVTKAADCWLWAGARNTYDYGVLMRKRQRWLAHRYAWVLTNGPIPDGLNILHRCDTPRCVNPSHLFLGTYRDNTQDMLAKGRGGHLVMMERSARRTHCKRGHALTSDNRQRAKDRPTDRCKTCRRDDARNRWRVLNHYVAKETP